MHSHSTAGKRFAPICSLRRWLAVAVLSAAALAAPAGARAAGEVVEISNIADMGPLADAGNLVCFAIQARPPLQKGSESPPLFPPVRVGSRAATGSVLVGCWDGREVQSLLSLPGDVATGAQAGYFATAMSGATGGIWVTGVRNEPGKQGGRFWLARIDAGRLTRFDRDDGVPAVALAAAKDAVYVARNGLADLGAFRGPVKPTLERYGAWRLPVSVSPGGSDISNPSFQWAPGHGLAANAHGVWGLATFRGSIRIGGRTLSSPKLSDLPLTGDLPPRILQQMRAMLRQSGPPDGLPGNVLVHVSGDGGLSWAVALEPAALHVDEAGGVVPPIVHPTALTVDEDGNAYVLATLTGSLRIGRRTLTTPLDDPERCFLAAFDAQGDIRWLQHFSCSRPINLSVAGRRLLVFTEHEILLLDLDSGRGIDRRTLPSAEHMDGPVTLRWRDAIPVDARRIALSGVFRGRASLLGKPIDASHVVGLVVRCPISGLEPSPAGD